MNNLLEEKKHRQLLLQKDTINLAGDSSNAPWMKMDKANRAAMSHE
jgi:hypothetical protein